MIDPNGYSGEKPPKRRLIELRYGQSAERGQCGSCEHFRRLNENMSGISEDERYKYNSGGYCEIKLPPQVQIRFDPENSNGTNRCNDTHGCDLWKATGFSYLVKQRIDP